MPGKKDLEQALQKGITYTLTYQYELERASGAWYKVNKDLASARAKTTIKYSQTNKSYIVTKNGKNTPFFEFEQAWGLASNHTFNLATKEWQKSDHIISVKAKGESIRLFFPLDMIYRGFVARVDFSLGWQESTFPWP